MIYNEKNFKSPICVGDADFYFPSTKVLQYSVVDTTGKEIIIKNNEKFQIIRDYKELPRSDLFKIEKLLSNWDESQMRFLKNGYISNIPILNSKYYSAYQKIILLLQATLDSPNTYQIQSSNGRLLMEFKNGIMYCEASFLPSNLKKIQKENVELEEALMWKDIPELNKEYLESKQYLQKQESEADYER